jgi:hypothetical protein
VIATPEPRRLPDRAPVDLRGAGSLEDRVGQVRFVTSPGSSPHSPPTFAGSSTIPSFSRAPDLVRDRPIGDVLECRDVPSDCGAKRGMPSVARNPRRRTLVGQRADAAGLHASRIDGAPLVYTSQTTLASRSAGVSTRTPRQIPRRVHRTLAMSPQTSTQVSPNVVRALSRRRRSPTSSGWRRRASTSCAR